MQHTCSVYLALLVGRVWTLCPVAGVGEDDLESACGKKPANFHSRMIFTFWEVTDVRVLEFQTHRHCLALFNSSSVGSRGLDELGIADSPGMEKGGNGLGFD